MPSDPPRSAGWMRAQMPGVAQIIDALRQDFCETANDHRELNEFMRRGLAGEADCFFAREGDVAIGTPFRACWLSPAPYARLEERQLDDDSSDRPFRTKGSRA